MTTWGESKRRRILLEEETYETEQFIVQQGLEEGSNQIYRRNKKAKVVAKRKMSFIHEGFWWLSSNSHRESMNLIVWNFQWLRLDLTVPTLNDLNRKY